jgi:hypothetical protein
VSASAATLPERPWIETDALETRLAGADPDAARFCRELAQTGLAVIDLGSDGVALADRVVAATEPYFTAGDVYRVQDAWLQKPAVKAAATHPRIVELLELAHGRRPFPFQTLNFQRGTQQDIHSDAVHFHSEPAGFMCGVWIALEDVTEASGPLAYLPGSHKLPFLSMQAAGVEREVPTPDDYVSTYLPALRSQLEQSGLPRAEALLKKGQALVWASNLAHGGSAIRDPASTRRSLVVHFYFEDCLYYTPMVSNPAKGVYRTRLPLDAATGRWVWPTDRAGRRVPVPKGALVEAVYRRITRRPFIDYLAGSPRARRKKTRAKAS